MLTAATAKQNANTEFLHQEYFSSWRPAMSNAKTPQAASGQRQYLAGFFFRLVDFSLGAARKFKDALAWLFVEAQTLENGCAHLDSATLAFVGPFGKFNFRHQLRLDPMRLAGAFDFYAKWIFGCLQRMQFLPHGCVCGFSKSASCVANVDQLAVLVIEPQHQRAKVLTSSARISVAGNYALLPPRDLDLQPLARAFLPIRAGPQLGNNAFQPLVARHLVKRRALFRIMIGVAQKAF